MIKEAASMVLADELELLRKEIIKHHVDAGQMASGKTAASLRVQVSGDEGTLFGRSPFGVLETGRKPGKVPANFQGIIRAWMKAKGIVAQPIPYKTNRPHKYTPEERGELTLSFLIARKIRKSGTRLFRTGGRADIYSNAIPATKQRIMMRIVELVKTDIKSIKLNNYTLIK